MYPRSEDSQRIRQQKLRELNHAIRYANTAAERHEIAMQIDFWRRQC